MGTGNSAMDTGITAMDTGITAMGKGITAMDSFFERMEPWRKSEGSLHLYVLPAEDERELFFNVQQSLAGIENLPLMPAAYLHATLLRLAQFDEDVSQKEYSRLGREIDEFCATLEPFDLDFGPPVADDVALCCWATATPAWEQLTQGCRATVERAWGVEPFASPAVPHVSLAYAKGMVNGDLVAATLEGVASPGRIRVDKVHLVSVTARPERGTFDFTELANWDLGS